MPKEIKYDEHALRFGEPAAGWVIISEWDTGFNDPVEHKFNINNQVFHSKHEATEYVKSFSDGYTVTIKAVRFGQASKGAELNPDETFVLSAISRSIIAEDLNEYLDDCDITHNDRLKPNDKRLTHSVCIEYAEEYSEIINNDDFDEDFKYNEIQDLYYKYLNKLNISTGDEDDG